MKSVTRPLWVTLISLGITGAAIAQDGRPGERTRGVRIISDVVPADRAPNPAKLSVELAQGSDVALGAKVVFRISAAQPGYLVLLDVNAEGKTTQIYPNLFSMRMQPTLQQDVNLVKPGRPVTLPNSAGLLSNFEFVVEAPAGRGVVIALLSSIPVHMVDLPDIPPDVVDRSAEAEFVYEAATKLRAAPAGTPALVASKWSLAATRYAIR